MRRAYEEISDDEWEQHRFNPSRLFKRPAAAAAGRPTPTHAPPIESFSYNPSNAAAASSNGVRREPTPVVILDDDNDDLALLDDFSHGEPVAERAPRRRLILDDDGDGYGSQPSAAPPPAAGNRDSDDEEEINWSELEGEDEDATAASNHEPLNSRPRRRRFVLDDDDDGRQPSAAPPLAAAGGRVSDDEDEINWSELEGEDDDDTADWEVAAVTVSQKPENGVDVVRKALRKCAGISAALRQELYGTSALECDRYAETEASTCRIVTQEDVDAACTSTDVSFRPILKPYQLVGVNFLLLLHRKNIGGAILADEMGLGKTVQAVTYIALLKHLYNDPGPHLIVCPASVLENWERELRKWCPSFSVILFHGAGKTAFSRELRSVSKAGSPPFNVMLVCYTLFERRSSQQKDDRKVLKRWRWTCVLMDEAHVLKDKNSYRWRNLMSVAQNAQQRLMLTGTPLQNDLHELWSLLEFMMPDIFSTGDVDLKKVLDAEDHDLVSRMKSILGPFILRRLKSDVMQQLVPKTQHVRYVSMGSEQSKAYKEAIHEYRAACQARGPKSSAGISKTIVGLLPKRQISNYFTQFRKIANHPLLVRRIYSDADVIEIAKALYPVGVFGFECTMERAIQELKGYSDFSIHKLLLSYGEVGSKGTLTDEHVLGSAKCQVLAELLPSLINGGHRVLIFSQWTAMLDILEWTLEVLGLTYQRLDGGTQVAERQSIVDTFNNDLSIFACLLSTRAGGQGLNLIGADTVIIHDMDFNPQMDRQAENRCHRIGQEKPVSVYRLVTKNTVDEKIYEIARRKLVLDAAVLESGADLDDENDLPEKTMGEILASLLLV